MWHAKCNEQIERLEALVAEQVTLIATLRTELAAKAIEVVVLERQIETLTDDRNEWRSLAKRRPQVIQPGDPNGWAQNQAEAQRALKTEETKKIRDHFGGLMERLEEVWGDGLSNEQLAELHKDDA